jgi:xylulokinase
MFLGLDLGTSGLKGVVMDEKGEVIALDSVTLDVSSPLPLWSEQDPLSWWQAVKVLVAKLEQSLAQKSLNFRHLKGIGVSGQMHGATFLDEQGEVLRPCILWNDGRSYQQCQRLMKACPELLTRSGNLAMPGFTAPKVLWLQEYEPETYAKLKYVLLPKDYLCYRLTACLSTDCSDASGTLWLNPQTRQWDDVLLAATGLQQENMPKVHEACDLVALLTREVAEELNLPQVPVVAGAGDNAAGAVGMGVINPGQGLLSLGTSGVYFTVSDCHRANPENTVHAFCHALPNRWHQMGVTLSAANSLSWLANLVDKPVPELIQNLSRYLKAKGDSRTSVMFLPYLNGERTPHNDAQASGQFIGIKSDTGLEDMTLAVLEGVAFSLLDCQNALSSANSVVTDLSLIGGGAKSELWRQVLANVLNKRLIYRDGGDVGPGLGAARLALIGVKQGELKQDDKAALETIIQQACPMPKVLAIHEPESELRGYYQQKYALYQACFESTKHLNQEMAKLVG